MEKLRLVKTTERNGVKAYFKVNAKGQIFATYYHRGVNTSNIPLVDEDGNDNLPKSFWTAIDDILFDFRLRLSLGQYEGKFDHLPALILWSY